MVKQGTIFNSVHNFLIGCQNGYNKELLFNGLTNEKYAKENVFFLMDVLNGDISRLDRYLRYVDRDKLLAWCMEWILEQNWDQVSPRN